MLQPSTNLTRYLIRFIQLLFISFVTASLFIVMLSFDPNSVESPTHLSFWERVIWVPLVFTIYFTPFVIVIGCITLFVKAVVEKIINVQHIIILDSIVYITCSIIVIPILPDMITNAATSTGYQFFIPPYYLLPFTGAVLLIGFDYINKKKNFV